MNAVVEWFQRLAGHRAQRPQRVSGGDGTRPGWPDAAEERGAPESDWVWAAMFSGDMPASLMEILVRGGRERPGEGGSARPEA